MRINFLTTELRTGGAERCLTQVALGLQRRGATVQVMSLAPLPGPPRDQLLLKLNQAGVPVHSADASHWSQLARAVRRVRSWLKSTEPEVLQTFLFHANVLGALCAEAPGGPQNRPSVVFGIRVAEPKLGRILAESRAARRANRVVCVSNSVESFVRNNWPTRLHPLLTTIPNGIDPAGCLARPVNWPATGVTSEGPIVLFLGRLHPQKGVDLLVSAASAMFSAVPKMTLVVVGEGPMEEQVKQAVAAAPAGRMAWLPWQQDVASLYAGADLVLMPSRFEGMPNVILEAMCAGRPVLASQVEGVRELLGPDADEQSFPVGDQDSMITGIQRLLTSEGTRELGMRNRERILHHFTLESMVTRYQLLYQQLLSERTK